MRLRLSPVALGALLATVLLALVSAALVLQRDRSTAVRVTASSTAAGFAAAALVPAEDDDRTRGPVPADGTPAWRSDGETVGAWVQLTWAEPRTVDRVRLDGVTEAEWRPTSAVLTFDDGSALLLTPDPDGDAVVSFPPRPVSWARLTVAEAGGQSDAVALAALSVDESGTSPHRRGDPLGAPVPTASSTQQTPTSSLVDGDLPTGETGREWRAAPDDADPWVQLTWADPWELASVQVVGPSAPQEDPVTAPLHGTLRFSDGSSVVVSGVAGGDAGPTTVAFAPRMASWVRLELQAATPGTSPALREVAALVTGTTPPAWPGQDVAAHRYAAAATPAAGCDATTPPVGTPAEGRLSLVCPAPGAAVEGRARVVVAAPAGADLQARAWRTQDSGSGLVLAPVALATADAAGRGVLDLDVSVLPHGPVTVEVEPLGSAREGTAPVRVQLFHLGGTRLESPGHAPSGMTLQWSDEFTDPLSVSIDGAGARYAAVKPEPGGASLFGDAVFVDPADGAGTLSTVGEDYLRIRAEPIGDRVVDAPWGQQHVSGLLSSLRVGASGFAAQYGYFEVRMTGAPGPGTWPAFWMLNTEAAARDTGTAAEVDAVELYGHNPYGSCHRVHSWGVPDAQGDDVSDCEEVNGFSDWTMTWHTYGVRIVPGGAVFSIDGVEVATEVGLSHTEQPFFFLINLALGSGWPVDLSATGGISDLYVDWVRVYT